MALGYLTILFITITIISVLSIFILYISKNYKVKDATFYFLAIFSLLLAFMSMTSLPSNFFFQRFISIAFGLLSIMGVIIKIKNSKNTNVAYLLVTASTILNLFTLFFL